MADGGKQLRSGKEYINRGTRNRNIPLPRSRPRGRPPRSNRRYSEATSVDFFSESESLTNLPIRSALQSAQRPNSLNQNNTPRLGDIERTELSFEAFNTVNMNENLSSHSVGTSQSPDFSRSNNSIAANLSRSSLDDLLEYDNVSTSAQNISGRQNSRVHNSNNPFSPSHQFLDLPDTPIVSTRMTNSEVRPRTPSQISDNNSPAPTGSQSSNIATVSPQVVSSGIPSENSRSVIAASRMRVSPVTVSSHSRSRSSSRVTPHASGIHASVSNTAPPILQQASFLPPRVLPGSRSQVRHNYTNLWASPETSAPISRVSTQNLSGRGANNFNMTSSGWQASRVGVESRASTPHVSRNDTEANQSLAWDDSMAWREYRVPRSMDSYIPNPRHNLNTSSPMGSDTDWDELEQEEGPRQFNPNSDFGLGHFEANQYTRRDSQLLTPFTSQSRVPGSTEGLGQVMQAMANLDLLADQTLRTSDASQACNNVTRGGPSVAFAEPIANHLETPVENIATRMGARNVNSRASPTPRTLASSRQSDGATASALAPGLSENLVTMSQSSLRNGEPRTRRETWSTVPQMPEWEHWFSNENPADFLSRFSRAGGAQDSQAPPSSSQIPNRNSVGRSQQAQPDLIPRPPSHQANSLPTLNEQFARFMRNMWETCQRMQSEQNRPDVPPSQGNRDQNLLNISHDSDNFSPFRSSTRHPEQHESRRLQGREVDTLLQTYGVGNSQRPRDRNQSMNLVTSPFTSLPQPQVLVNVSASDIAEFSGRFEDYAEFRENFLGYASAIPSHMRLIMLKRKLNDECKNLISTVMGQDDTAFQQAWTILNSRFDRPSYEGHVLIAKLHAIVHRDKCKEPHELRKLHSDVTRCYNQILQVDPRKVGPAQAVCAPLARILYGKSYSKAHRLMFNDPDGFNLTAVLAIMQDHISQLDAEDVTDRCIEHVAPGQSNSSGSSKPSGGSYSRGRNQYKGGNYNYSMTAEQDPTSEDHAHAAVMYGSAQEGSSSNIKEGGSRYPDSSMRSPNGQGYTSPRGRSPNRNSQRGIGNRDRSKSGNRFNSPNGRIYCDNFRCTICLGNEHSALKCTESPPDLSTLIRERGLCFVCLRPSHRSRNCSLLEVDNDSIVCRKADCGGIPHCRKLCKILENSPRP